MGAAGGGGGGGGGGGAGAGGAGALGGSERSSKRLLVLLRANAVLIWSSKDTTGEGEGADDGAKAGAMRGAIDFVAGAITVLLLGADWGGTDDKKEAVDEEGVILNAINVEDEEE